MDFSLRFGDQRWNVHAPDQLMVGRFRGPESSDPLDVSETMREQLEAPLELPALRRALVPGDRVAIVVDGGLEDVALYLAPILDVMAAAGVEADGVTTIFTQLAPGVERGDPRTALPEAYREINVVWHDPANKELLGYLASTKDGRRVYLPRAATEADFILLLGRVGPDSLMGAKGTASYLFPGLADETAQRHGRLLASDVRSDAATLRQRQGSAEVAWLAGVQYAVGVELDRESQPTRIVAGHFEHVQKSMEATSRDEWTPKPPKSVPDIVVATVAPSGRPATWESTAAALAAAGRLAGPDCDLVVLSDLSEPPGPTTRWLVDHDNPAAVFARLRSPEVKDADDVVATAQLIAALGTGKIHLATRLQPELVESMGFVHVPHASSLEHLIRRRSKCYMLEDADRVWA